MDTTPVDLSHLFEQLGLDNHPLAISQFMASHRLLPNTLLIEAPFWNGAQKGFLKEALEADAQWTELVEQLDAQLRKP